LFLFSSLDHDGHFEENIIYESVAKRKKVSYKAIQWRKNKSLQKLKLLLEEFFK